MEGASVALFVLLLAVFETGRCDFYDDLREAQDEIKQQGSTCNSQKDAQDLASLGKELEDSISDLQGVLGKAGDLFSGNKQCVFQCPEGKKIRAKKDHKPTYNGCGTDGLGIQVKEEFKPTFTKCCNKHDLCYDKCQANKKECDDKFNECMRTGCFHLIDDDIEELEECYMMGELLYKGVDVLGCQAFMDSQKQSCVCK